MDTIQNTKNDLNKRLLGQRIIAIETEMIPVSAEQFGQDIVPMQALLRLGNGEVVGMIVLIDASASASDGLTEV